MAKALERESAGLGELRAWYLGSLRPKLAGATGAGAIAPAKALALDRAMNGLLDLASRDSGLPAKHAREAA
jgi:hypothetical protein